MSLGCKPDYIIKYNVAKREPVIGAGMGIRTSPVMGGGVEELGISQNTALLQESVSCVNIASNASPCTPSGDWNPTPCPPPLIPHLEHKKKFNINLRKKLKQVVLGEFFFLSKEH